MLPIVPNYLQNPTFPYKGGHIEVNKQNEISLDDTVWLRTETHKTASESAVRPLKTNTLDVLTVKVRIADHIETDFVEVDVCPLTYSRILEVFCDELDISCDEVRKIRKLPNVVIRKDRDVERLKGGEELEVVLI